MATLDLSDSELQNAAQAARVAANQAQQDAEKQGNPSIRETFARSQASFTALSDKFERARRV